MVLAVLIARLVKGKGAGKSAKDTPVFLTEISYEQIISGEIHDNKGLYARLEEETKDLKIRRSPFSKQHLEAVSGPYLNGIFWDPHNPTAIINDQIVEHGSRISGYTVVEIKKDAVILMEDASKTEYRLELFK
jgi:hypothetical protein